jgi:3-hydroxymyristoyl/3-hydroxydecanoyl-(acyl carrier protein) dehydratase
MLERDFPRDHAAAQGHFPGNPIIPGACLLSEILHVIEARLGRSLYPCVVASAKFTRPVRPGDSLSIEFSEVAGRRIKFSGSVDRVGVLTGEIVCDFE